MIRPPATLPKIIARWPPEDWKIDEAFDSKALPVVVDLVSSVGCTTDGGDSIVATTI